jgi:hypothetical protein
MKGRMLLSALAIVLTASLVASAEIPEGAGESGTHHFGEQPLLTCDSPAGGETLDVSPKPGEEEPECPPTVPCNSPCRPRGPCTYEDLGITHCRIGPLSMHCPEGETVHLRRCTSCTHPEAMCWAIQPVSVVCRQGLQPHPIER